jgi:multidrug efflux pump subunit AcrB
VAVFTLPVAQYPDVTPPTVLVTAHYPGANAETVRDTVAAPIEEQWLSSRREPVAAPLAPAGNHPTP